MNSKYKGKTVVAWGDSLTDNGEASGWYTSLLHPSTSTWTNLLELETGMRVYNKGVGGNTTQAALARSSDVVSTSATYCIIMIGANNIYLRNNKTYMPTGYSLDATIADIDTMIQTVEDASIIPVLATEPVGYYDASTAAEETSLIEGLRQGIIAYALNNNVLYVDLCKTAVYTDKSLRPLDNVHPLQAGHEIIAREFIIFFDALIPEKTVPEPVNDYESKSTVFSYSWDGAEQSRYISSDILSWSSTGMSGGSLTEKYAKNNILNYTYAGEKGVLFDAVSNEFSYALPQKSTAVYSPEYVWSGTGGGAATVASWALDGISVSNGVLSLIADDSQAEIDAINGEVV